MTKKSSKKNLAPTTPDLIVLSLLSEHPRHGYEINCELRRREVQDWAEISRPQIYYSLTKLNSQQLIVSVIDKIPAQGAERQIYRITAKGKRALEKALAQTNWALHRPLSSFLTWLALSPHSSTGAFKQLIAQRRNFLQQELAREQGTFEALKNKNGPLVIPGKLMIELTIKQFQVELDWLEKVEKSR